MSNPLFTQGFYFFSGMYDDSLIGSFYQKISSETYGRAVQTQNDFIGRHRASPNGPVHWSVTMGDFKTDANYNFIMGLPEGTLTAEVPNLILPILNPRRFWNVYAHKSAQVHAEDAYFKLDVFDKFITVQFGAYRITKAWLVMDPGNHVRMALPYDESVLVGTDVWGRQDYDKIKSLIRSTPTEPVWIFYDEQSKVYHYTHDEIQTAIKDTETGDYIMSVDVSLAMNSVVSPVNDDYANSWDFLAYSPDRGQLYLSCPCTLDKIESDQAYFRIPQAFFDYLKPNGALVGVGGQYGYFIHRPNRRHMVHYAYDAQHKPVINLDYQKNPAGNINVEIYEFDAAHYLKGRRLYSTVLTQTYYPNIYDFQKLNKNHADLLIEVNEHLPNQTNQVMRNSIQPLMDSLGDFYTTFVVNGYDVHTGQGISRLQRYAPNKFYSTTEDYLASEYNGDLRAYILDKLMQTFERDPYLNLLYHEHMAQVDPMMLSVSGTPKSFGFNTQLLGEYSGDNPVVMTTKTVIPEDEEYYVFQEPHSYITFRSNNEPVAANLYLNGKYLRATCQKFYAGVNYLFYPVEAIASVINTFEEEEDLIYAQPMTLDYFPHTHMNRISMAQEYLTIPAENFKLFQQDEDQYIRLRDLQVFNSDTHTWVTNWLEDFDVLYEVNSYEIQSTSARNTILLDKNQDINGIIPMLTGFYANMSWSYRGPVQVSLKETLSELVSAGVMEASDTISLMNKSLNLKYVTFVPETTAVGKHLAFGLGNFKSEYRFTGADLEIYPSSAIGTLEHAVVDPFKFGGVYNQYVLFRNGHLVSQVTMTPQNNKVLGSLNLIISEFEVQPSDEFILMHLPVPIWMHTLGISEGLKYMQPANPSGRTIETIWPDNYTPYQDGLLIAEEDVDGSFIPLEFNVVPKFSDSGLRLPPKSRSTNIEGAIFYDSDRALRLPDQSMIAPVAWRYPIDLPFTHPTNFPKINVLNNILGPGELVVNWFDLALADTDDKIRSIYYGKNIMRVTGNFVSGKFSGYDNIWEDIRFPEGFTCRTILYQHLTFVALGTYSNQAAYSSNGVTWETVNLPRVANWYSVIYGYDRFVAIAMDSAFGAYSEDGTSWTEMSMPANRRWTSVAYGNGTYVAVASTSKYGARSIDGIHWTEITLPHGDWCSVAFISNGFLAIDPTFNIGAFSTDGLIWTLVDLPSNIDWLDVNNGIYHFSIVANTNSVDSRFGGITIDGVNWEVTPNGSKYWDPLAEGSDTRIKFGFIDEDTSIIES